jgi:HAD superfamily hydrolase (TIGR01509 family)
VRVVSTRAGILVDVDGTLVDTNYLHALSWSRALADAGEWAPMNAIHRLVGMGGDQLVETLLGHPSEEASECRTQRYAELIDEARVFPDAQGLLTRAHDEGLIVVLASSAPRDELDRMIELLDVGDAIDATTSADDVTEAKPSPEVFEAALKAGQVDRELCLVVGDSIWDVQAARAAGIGCVAVESGGFSAHELREEGAVAVYRDAHEVLTQYRTGPIGHLVGAVSG